MATVDLQSVLGAPQLCGMIQQTKTGIPNVLPPGMFNRDKLVEKDYGSYTRVTGTRTTARIAKYGSPAQRRQLKGLEDVPVKLLHTIESIELKMADFRGLIKKDSTGSNLLVDEKGQDEIARQIREARTNVDNLRTGAATQALFNGAIWFDNDGNLLPTSSGAVTTPSFGIPAGNQNQLNILGTGNILSAGWQTTSTDIASQVLGVKQAAIRLTGYPIKYALYGINVPKYLTTNTTLSNYFIRNLSANPKYIETGDIPNPLLGLTWLPAYDSFFEDNNGVLQGLVGPDQVVFMPEPSLDWCGTLEGKFDVPGSSVLGKTGLDLLGDMQTMDGMFAFAAVEYSGGVVRIEIFYGDTFLPVIKNNKAIFQATVNF